MKIDFKKILTYESYKEDNTLTSGDYILKGRVEYEAPDFEKQIFIVTSITKVPFEQKEKS